MVISGLRKVAVALFVLTTLLPSPVLAEKSAAEIEALRLKAKSGDVEALHALGVALQDDADASNDIEGRDLVIQAANAGRSGSAYWLGQAYLYGWYDWGRAEVGGKAKEGMYWLRRAGEIAESDHERYAADLYKLLGAIYAGHSIREFPPNMPQRDVAEATRWFRLCAADMDSYGGRYCRGQLGLLLIETPGAEDEGVAWLEKAAAFGDPWSMNRLGDIYAEGKIVAPDLALAWGWYERSAKWTERHGDQTDLVHDSEYKAKDLRAKMTPDQTARGEELAQQFKPLSTP